MWPDAAAAGNAGAGPAAYRLRMCGVRKAFGATVALAGVDFAVKAGEIHALVGENGAGKSTLMKVLSGAIQPDRGESWLDGRPFRPRGPAAARRAGVAMIYQELSLAPHLSVTENLMLGIEPVRFGIIRRREARERSRAALAQLQHADLSLDTPVRRLPPAIQQVVEIARALVFGCRVLILDEPTSSLGRDDAERLFQLLARLKTQGLAIVYISHFLEEVKRIADRFTVLRDGQTVGDGVTADSSIAEIVRLMVGRQVSELYPRSARSPGETVLEVSDLAGGSKPVNASLELRCGEVVGIAGLVGAGRTEFLRALFGLDSVRAGRLCLAGYRGAAEPADRWSQGAGFLSEDRKNEGLALARSLADNLTLTRLTGMGPAGLILPGRQRQAATTWLTALQVRARSPGQAVSELSGGNQQKIAMARLLHHGAEVLLLDEPTRGIDVGSKAHIYRLIDDLACGRGGGTPKAVLVVSSYLPELLGICDRIAVMCRGHLGPARPVEEWNEHKLMLAATGVENP
jgi:ribose transport system ATP-binding protein